MAIFSLWFNECAVIRLLADGAALIKGNTFEATSVLLTDLLDTRPRYRSRWRARVQRDRSGGRVSIAAVAQVLAEHLWDSGEFPESEQSLPRNLKDRVRRALDGTMITTETLAWLIDAFHMDPRDAECLRATHESDSGSRPDGISDAVREPRKMVRRQWHRTVTVFERYFLDRERQLTERRTKHVIMALEDGVDSYLFNHESSVAAIEVMHGGTLGPEHRYDGLVSHEIVFPQPLKRGQRTSFEYRTAYHPAPHPPQEVRRPARGRIENFDMAVHFAPPRLPSRLWWATWSDHHLGDPVQLEPAQVCGTGRAHRYVPFVERSVVGFRWNW
ncbi:hypothetical protein OTC26_016920 [Streptomyces tirandamycinicus]|uniref:hypothetical protein n=1 Tax=Streptomyces tirandamycinicus TaxID=2174846 RepID=UPI00226D7424|nr:hypothetical protein [Streptomyces tirandamycinicus]MCY0982787.1 hypothetical protein [Streptomyces tirandamycinicus]